MTFLAHFVLLSLGAGDKVTESIIQSQAERLAKIKSIHWKLESWVGPLEKGQKDAKFLDWQRAMVWEIWQDGARQKEIERAFVIFGPNGFTHFPQGNVMISSTNDKEARRLTGWDPENPLPWPLDFLSRGTSFSRARGEIFPGKRKHPGFISGLYDVVLQYPLAKLAEKSEIISTVPKDGNIQLEIKESKADYFVGMKIEIDPEHGYQWKKITYKNGNWSEVEEFSEPAKGIWVPKRMRSKSGDHAAKATIECEINIPISDGDFEMEFPEGIQVEEWKLVPHDATSERGQSTYFLWGQDGPAQTFSLRSELSSAQFKTAMVKFGGVIVGLVLMLTSLFWLKRRYVRRKVAA